MSEKPVAVAEPVITLDDLRHKALRIREDVEDEARDVAARRGTQVVVAGVVVVLAVISVAYMVGTMAGRRSAAAPYGY